MSNKNLDVLLKAMLDKSGIHAQLGQIQEIIKKYPLELTPELKQASLKNQLKSICRSVAEDFNQTFQTNLSGKDLFHVYEQKAKQLQQRMKEIKNIQLLSNGGIKNDYATQIAKLDSHFRNLGFTQDEVNQKLKNVTSSFEKLKSLINQPVQEGNYEKILSLHHQLQKELIRSGKDYSRLQSSVKEYVSMQERLSKANEILAWNKKNPNAAQDTLLNNEAYIHSLKNLNAQMTKMDFDRISKGFQETQHSVGYFQNLGAYLKAQLSQAGQSFTQWFSINSGVLSILHQLQKIPKEVIKVNSAMVELQKISQSTPSQMKKYFDEASISAKNLGSSVRDLLSATTEWSRLGHGLTDSKELAQAAALYKNISDYMDINEANSSLISTLKGFNLDVQEIMHIVDAFSEVGNHFAIGSSGIGEMMGRLASFMYADGNTLEQSIGLVTASHAASSDPDSIEAAYKTISMRIRGAKAEMAELGLETEGMAESTAALQKEILALSGVDIMKDKDTFKSIYEVLDELSGKWQNLTDIQKASISKLLSGHRQGNILSALMENFETARNAVQAAVNSTGSALKAQGEYEKTIQYSLDRLSASFQTFANHVLNSQFLKGIIDFGNGVLHVLDAVAGKLGSLGTIGLGASLFATFKNVGSPKR